MRCGVRLARDLAGFVFRDSIRRRGYDRRPVLPESAVTSSPRATAARGTRRGRPRCGVRGHRDKPDLHPADFCSTPGIRRSRSAFRHVYGVSLAGLLVGDDHRQSHLRQSGHACRQRRRGGVWPDHAGPPDRRRSHRRSSRRCRRSESSVPHCFFGDSAITPAISVLSAVEGLQFVDRICELVVPITAVIITGLFLVQRHGTGRWAGSSVR